MPNASFCAVARFVEPAPRSNPYLLAPPVPTTNSRMPCLGSLAPKGSWGFQRW